MGWRGGLGEWVRVGALLLQRRETFWNILEGVISPWTLSHQAATAMPMVCPSAGLPLHPNFSSMWTRGTNRIRAAPRRKASTKL